MTIVGRIKPKPLDGACDCAEGLAYVPLALSCGHRATVWGVVPPPGEVECPTCRIKAGTKPEPPRCATCGRPQELEETNE